MTFFQSVPFYLSSPFHSFLLTHLLSLLPSFLRDNQLKIGSDHLYYFLEGEDDLSGHGAAAAIGVAAANAAGAAGSQAATASGELSAIAPQADIYHGQRNAFPPGRVRRNGINVKRISKNIVDSAFRHA